MLGNFLKINFIIYVVRNVLVLGYISFFYTYMCNAQTLIYEGVIIVDIF